MQASTLSRLERTVYDELPYKSLPVEWSAPERLALASLLHGGPRPRLDRYRVLEIGCADGSNLVPMAFFRPNAEFVGVDSAGTQIALADERKRSLGLGNLEFACTDLRDADRFVRGHFDFIIAHGVFSWIPDEVRDAMLRLCAQHLRPDGLFYLNYNSNPGWHVRGLVRRLLLARTRSGRGLRERALLAQEVAARLAGSIRDDESPFTRLLAKELSFLSEHDSSYVAHEYLAADNHAYWRSEFIQLTGHHGFEYVADADFSYPSGREPIGEMPECLSAGLCGVEADDAMDLLRYRQLHSPILCLGPLNRRALSAAEFAELTVASCLVGCAGDHSRFLHPSGYEVEAREPGIREALIRLRAQWPKGARVGDLFQVVSSVMEDLDLLHRNGLIELRCAELAEAAESSELSIDIEASRGEYRTTAYHTREHYRCEPVAMAAAQPCGERPVDSLVP